MSSDIFVHRDPSPSLSRTQGPLSGKSVAVQANVSVRGWPAEAGSVALRGYVALEDATAVDRLRKAGALLVGGTRMSELGLGLVDDMGAQAVAEGHADLVLMTDSTGEARLAAAMANLWGLKPTYGLVSRYGLIGLIPSMECLGIVAKSAEDIAAVMEVISGRDPQDFSMPDDPVPDFRWEAGRKERKEWPRTIGFVRECVDMLSAPEAELFRSGLSRLQEGGYNLRGMEMADFDLFRTVHQVVGSVEASSSAGKYDGVRYGHRTATATNWNEMYLKTRAESFGPLIKSYLFQGAYFQFENYSAFENACRIRARLVKGMEDFLNRTDVLASPTRRTRCAAEKAETVGQVYDAFVLTLAANVAGLPALQVPGVACDKGVDLGLQLIGPRLSDPDLLRIGRNIPC